MIQKSIYISNYSYVVAFFCLLFLGCGNSYAQVKQSAFIDSIINKINSHGAKYHAPDMFVHFDKTIYSNNENVWFTAYVLDTTHIDRHKALIVNLIKDATRTIVLEDKFVMENGLGFGNMFIPDSVAAGNYTFVVYTNLLADGKPWAIFKQPVTIKTASSPTFTALLSPVDTAVTSVEKKVRLIANISAVELLPNAQVSYYIGSPANHLLSGKVKTDASGQYVFSIPSKLLSPGNNKLYVTVKHKGDEKEISMTLPVANQAPILNFYPEGGNLVNNLPAYIGWEAKNAGGVPLQVSAVLLKDDKGVDTIETNGYGMGKFLLTPKSGSKYVVKLNDNNMDKSYDLPAAVAVGPAIAIQQGLANDTLNIMLHDARPEKLFLLVHNYRQVFSATPIVMNGGSKRIKVLLNDIPKGINQLTLTDSLGRPFVQRTFFAHYNRKQSMQINTNEEYKTREKVSIKVKLNGLDTSAMALVSIAAVQENRIETKKKNDIESYFYLTNQLGDIPLKENYLGNNESDKQFLENVLLIKGWTRYKWTDVLKMTDTLLKFETPAFNAVVTTLAGRSLKKSVTSVLMAGTNINTLQTDSTGAIVLDDNYIITPPDKKLLFMVSGDNPDSYRTQVNDPFGIVSKNIPTQLLYKDYNTVAQQNTSSMYVPGNQKAIALKEVTIKDKKDDQFFGMRIKGNPCGPVFGDYVCRYGVINCPNHRNEPDNKDLPFPAGGCPIAEQKIKYSSTFKGIYSAMEFYPSDYSKLSPAAPEYISTIYWKHLSKITANKETELSFYTSDITGKFKIVIQGVTDNDVVYGEKIFNVVKPK